MTLCSHSLSDMRRARAAIVAVLAAAPLLTGCGGTASDPVATVGSEDSVIATAEPSEPENEPLPQEAPAADAQIVTAAPTEPPVEASETLNQTPVVLPTINMPPVLETVDIECPEDTEKFGQQFEYEFDPNGVRPMEFQSVEGAAVEIGIEMLCGYKTRATVLCPFSSQNSGKEYPYNPRKLEFVDALSLLCDEVPLMDYDWPCEREASRLYGHAASAAYSSAERFNRFDYIFERYGAAWVNDTDIADTARSWAHTVLDDLSEAEELATIPVSLIADRSSMEWATGGLTGYSFRDGLDEIAKAASSATGFNGRRYRVHEDEMAATGGYLESMAEWLRSGC